jgi:membrane protein
VKATSTSVPRKWHYGMRWVWHLGGLSAPQLAKNVRSEIDKDDVLGRAAQLSFYFLLALFPLLIFVSAVLGQVFAGNADLYRDLLSYLQNVMPISAYTLVRTTLDEIMSGSGGGRLSLSLLATLWTASSGMEAVINGLNVAYEVTERRPWWKRRIVAINLTILLAFISAVALLLGVFGGRIGAFVADRYGYGQLFGTFWVTVQFAFPPVFMLLVFTLIYRFAPNVRAHGWQALVPGAFVAVMLWMGATAMFRVYLVHFDSYSKTYGSLGAVIVLMLWLYLSGVAILIGGEVNCEIRKAAARAGVQEAKVDVEAPADGG